MPWKEATAMSERCKFIEQAQQERVNFSTLCREFGVGRTKGLVILLLQNKQNASRLQTPP